jgi:hypothetical protein
MMGRGLSKLNRNLLFNVCAIGFLAGQLSEAQAQDLLMACVEALTPCRNIQRNSAACAISLSVLYKWEGDFAHQTIE